MRGVNRGGHSCVPSIFCPFSVYRNSPNWKPASGPSTLAIRAFMPLGEDNPKKHDKSSLRLQGTVRDPINPEATIWYREEIGRGRCPNVNTSSHT